MILLGLGSNCGDRIGYLRAAIQKLKSGEGPSSIKIFAISPIYESDALLPENAPPSWDQAFLNLTILAKTNLSPTELLKVVKSIEKSIGRKDRGRWAPREIDIDILAMDSLIFEAEGLKIPHPSLLDRPFAMLPLADLLPQWKYPIPGSNSNRSAMEIVSQWKGKALEQIPSRTHRSTQCLTEFMGILNITPNSFSDGGRFLSPEAVLNQARQLVSDGVRVLDLGAEATNPSATPISPDEEWQRLEPIIAMLQSEVWNSTAPVQLSLDTRHAEVAVRGIQCGVNWINDVSGFDDIAMRKAVVESNVHLVMMHSLVVPANKQINLSTDRDPVSEILSWAENRIETLVKLGISRERIIFDPGFGFGKTIEQSWILLREMRRFHELGVRILAGHSRKSFLSSITGSKATERDIETAALTLGLAEKGVDYLRVHNAEINARSLKSWTQFNGVSQWQ